MFTPIGLGLASIALCLFVDSSAAAHVEGPRERQCKIDHHTCVITTNGFATDRCDCLVNGIACYPRSKCDLAVFTRDADRLCDWPIPRSVFADNCARYSDAHMEQSALGAILAWCVCSLVLGGLVIYLVVVTRNRNEMKWQQDMCVATTALFFTVLISLAWISGMASLFFIIVYTVFVFLVYFGCFYGTQYNAQQTVDGSEGSEISHKHETAPPEIQE